MNTSRHLCFVVAVVLVFPTLSIAQVPDVSGAQLPAPLRGRVEADLQKPGLVAYRGWVKYLAFEAATELNRNNLTNVVSTNRVARLVEWLGRIESEPDLFSKLRGVQEWAYESAADGSGQPFKLNIPTDYDPARPAPLTVYMHGYSGNHLEHSTGIKSHGGFFEMAVLGRGRGVWYYGLAEADVLDAIGYVERYWSVDADQVHLAGGSMGGSGTYRLGARYPHLFASGQPTCGLGLDLPPGNLLTFPIYATHSDDDWTVPVILDRGLLNALRKLGGQVIFDETNGFGHAVWNYTAGNERGNAWAARQVRPNSTTVRHVDFTALDGMAARGWWAEVAEWGAEPRPARFILTSSPGNILYAQLDNITRLRLRIPESPFDRATALRVSVAGVIPFEVPMPLPDSVVLVETSNRWALETNAEPPSFRLHTPGGPLSLYDGSPLLIVYGTQGDIHVREAMHDAAEAASRSANPGWVGEGGEAGSDGVPHAQLLYGHLRMKPDRGVTEADLRDCNIVLVGTAAQNSLAARLAHRLPVRHAAGTITISDGTELPATNSVLGLVHYNPLAPRKLIFWVASDQPQAYSAGNRIASTASRTLIGADLVVMTVDEPRLVVTRSFDSRWRWRSDPGESDLLPEGYNNTNFAERTAEAVRRAVGADFGIAMNTELIPSRGEVFVQGTTRLGDWLRLFYQEPIGIFDATGAELLAMQKALKGGDASAQEIRFQPPIDEIAPDRIYRVAIPGSQAGRFASSTRSAPASFRITEAQVRDALRRFLLR